MCIESTAFVNIGWLHCRQARPLRPFAHCVKFTRMTARKHFRLPAHLRALRVRKTLSQTEIALKCGVTRTYICSVEHGRVMGPSEELVDKMVGAMAMTTREASAFIRLAAQDRAMRAVISELPERAQRFVSVCMEADRLLPDQDVETWIARLEKTVQERTDFVVHIQRDEESAMP